MGWTTLEGAHPGLAPKEDSAKKASASDPGLAFLFAEANHHEWVLLYPTAMIDVLFLFGARKFEWSYQLCKIWALHCTSALVVTSFSATLTHFVIFLLFSEIYMINIQILWTILKFIQPKGSQSKGTPQTLHVAVILFILLGQSFRDAIGMRASRQYGNWEPITLWCFFTFRNDYDKNKRRLSCSSASITIFFLPSCLLFLLLESIHGLIIIIWRPARTTTSWWLYICCFSPLEKNQTQKLHIQENDKHREDTWNRDRGL